MKKKDLPPPFAFFYKRPRRRSGITLAEAVAIARRYGLEGDIEHVCRFYGITPREALEDFDLIPPGASDDYIRLLARHEW